MTPVPIPQTDPRAAYLAQKSEIDAAIAQVLESGQYILGPVAERFESDFAAFLGLAHGIGCASGTDAVELALRACGIGAGDLVFTVSHTAVATVAAIERAGAIPVRVGSSGTRRRSMPRCGSRRRVARPRSYRCIFTASPPISA